MKFAISVALAFSLAACACTGVQVKEEQLAQFEKSKTTAAEVVQKLGPPTGSTLLPDGRRVTSHVYARAQARAENFIPLVGPLVGGHDTNSNVATLIFDKGGLLESVSASSTAAGTGMGLAAGGTTPRIGDQPHAAQ